MAAGTANPNFNSNMAAAAKEQTERRADDTLKACMSWSTLCRWIVGMQCTCRAKSRVPSCNAGKHVLGLSSAAHASTAATGRGSIGSSSSTASKACYCLLQPQKKRPLQPLQNASLPTIRITPQMKAVARREDGEPKGCTAELVITLYVVASPLC